MLRQNTNSTLCVGIQVWFQNQRAKVKKIQKKRKQDGKHDNENDSQGENVAGNANTTKSNHESKILVSINKQFKATTTKIFTHFPDFL